MIILILCSNIAITLLLTYPILYAFKKLLEKNNYTATLRLYYLVSFVFIFTFGTFISSLLYKQFL